MKYPKYSAYKDSQAEWLERVPEHWDAPLLKYVARLKYGDSLAANERDKSGNVLVYGSNGEVGVHSSANTKAPAIIVGRKGSYGKVTFTAEAAFSIDTTYFIDSTCTNHHLRWLYYALQPAGLDTNSQDTGVPGLSREAAYSTRFVAPSYSEQVTIAAFLDIEIAKIDKLIDKQERLITLLQEKRQALISHVVTKGLNPNVSMKDSGVEWFGKIPGDWHVDRLKWTAEGCNNGIWGEEADGGENDIICIRVADFDRQKFTVNLSDPTFRLVTQSQRASRELKQGDLLLEKSGGGEKQPVGVVVIYDHPEPAVCSNFVAKMVIRPEYNSRYICYVHTMLYSKRVNTRSIKQNTGIQNLDSSAYLDEKFPIPSLIEQNTIATFLDTETTQIDMLSEKARKVIDRLTERRIALISAVVTGKIDVRIFANGNPP